MNLQQLIPWRFRSRHNFVKAHANYFFRSILSTAPIKCLHDSRNEIHVLVCKRDMNMCLVAVKSFLRFYNQITVVIHDDGSLSNVDLSIIQNHLPGARVISRQEADLALVAVLPEDIARARSKYVLIMKVIDFNYFSTADKIILLDSDIVFTGEPEEAIDFLEKDINLPFYNSDPLKDTFRAKKLPNGVVLPENFNSGFLGYSGVVQLENIIFAIRTLDYFLEDQTVYAFLLASSKMRALDPERYYIFEGGDIPLSAKMVHFISPNRFTRGVYLELANKICKQLPS